MAQKTAYAAIRKAVPKIEEDRPLSEDIEKIKQTIKQETILKEVKNKTKIE